jgi:hypothetical protein
MYSTARCGLRAGHSLRPYAQQSACDTMTPGSAAWTGSPRHMKPLGYRAYHSGKWHISSRPSATPASIAPTLCRIEPLLHPHRPFLDDERLEPPERDNYYATIAIADHAVKTLREHASAHRTSPSSTTWRSPRRASPCTPCRRTSRSTGPSRGQDVARGALAANAQDGPGEPPSPRSASMRPPGTRRGGARAPDRAGR